MELLAQEFVSRCCKRILCVRFGTMQENDKAPTEHVFIKLTDTLLFFFKDLNLTHPRMSRSFTGKC